MTFFILIICAAVPKTGTSQQNAYASESKLIKQADVYFKEKDFADAYSLYSQLLSLYPKNTNYNFRLGTCMLFAKADKEKPIVYLEYAIKDAGIDHLAYYYLGRAYHLNYRFNDAINVYSRFKAVASSSELKEYPVDHLIEMCHNGNDMLKNLHDLEVLRRKRLNLSDYYHAYNLQQNKETLISEPEELKSVDDKNRNFNGIIFITPGQKLIFYTSYGRKEKSGKDIYMVRRQPNGALGKPEKLGANVNTDYDEDYPYYDSPAHTLYFCSKGHNSMGGYDIFKSEYNEAQDSWSPPVNLDFPINTPDDDILFIPDSTGQTAFFSSSRYSPQGYIDVYRIVLSPEANVSSPQSVTDSDYAKLISYAKKTAQLNVNVDTLKVQVALANAGKSEDIEKREKDKSKGGEHENNNPENPETSDSNRIENISISDNYRIDAVNDSITAALGFANAKIAYSRQLTAMAEENNINADKTNDKSEKRIFANRADSLRQKASEAEYNGLQGYFIAARIRSGAAKHSPNIPKDNLPVGSKDSLSHQLTSSIEINSGVQSKNAVSPMVSASELIRNQAQQSKEDSLQIVRHGDELSHESEETGKRSQNFINQAQSTDNPTEKLALLQQAKDLAEHKNEVDSSMAENKRELKKLIGDYSWLMTNAAKAEQMESKSPNESVITGTVNNDSIFKSLPEIAANKLNNINAGNKNVGGIEENKYVVLDSKKKENVSPPENGGVGLSSSGASSTVNGIGTDLNGKEKNLAVKSSVTVSGTTHQAMAKSNGNDLPINLTATVSDSTTKQVSTKRIGNDLSVNSPVTAADTTTKQIITKRNGNELLVNSPMPAADTTTKQIITKRSGNDVLVNSPLIDSDTTQQVITKRNGNGLAISAKNDTISSKGTNQGKQNVNSINVNPNNPINVPAANVANITSYVLANVTPKNASNVAVNDAVNLPANDTVNKRSPYDTKLSQDHDSISRVIKNTTNLTTNNKINVNSTNNGESNGTISPGSLKVPTSIKESVTTNKIGQLSPNNAVQNADTLNRKNVTTVRVSNASDSSRLSVSENQSTLVKGESIAKGNAPLKEEEPNLANTPEFTTTYKPHYTEQDAFQYTIMADSLNKQSIEHQRQAALFKAEAKKQRDKEETAIYRQKSDSLFTLSKQNEIQSLGAVSFANSNQYSSNSDKLTEFRDTLNGNTSKSVKKALKLVHKSEIYYNKAAIEKQKSEQSSNPLSALKFLNSSNKDMAKALTKQQVAMNDFLGEYKLHLPSHKVTITSPIQKETIAQANVGSPLETKPSLPDDHKEVAPKEIPESKPLVTAIESDVFEIKPTAPYSATQPIPVNPALPTGLIYKIQIGAFRKPIQQDLFKGMQPLSCETTTQGFKRYTVGMFHLIGGAKDALGKVKGIGYKDAFIVAYYNGKRVPLGKALGDRGDVNTASVSTANYPKPQQTGISGKDSVGQKAPSINQGDLAVAAQDTAASLSSIEVKDVKGLFYTVQVGAYKRKGPTKKLFRLHPLFSNRSSDGYIRYYFGNYHDIQSAAAAKKSVISNNGIEDAFIVAFNGGERIALFQADRLTENNAQPLAEETNKNKISSDNVNNSGLTVTFSVQIGAFSGQIPVDTANKLLALASSGVRAYKEGNGITSYTVGSFDDYRTADELKLQLLKEGFPGAFIVAFYKGKKISLTQAQSLLNK